MRVELVTLHTHTGFCGHGEGTVEELVATAHAAGVNTMAITEHYPLSQAFDPQGKLSMLPEKLPAYLEAIEEVRKKYPMMEIITGCELDWLGVDEDRNLTAEDLAPFSLVLGSVHFVDAWPFDDPSQRAAWEEPGAPDRIWTRYFALWCDAVSSDRPFGVMSHPDLAKKFNFYPTFALQPLYDDAAEACAAAERMVEVNTSGSYYVCKEMFPAPDLLKTFCRAGVPCTVGTDAHTAAHVVRDVRAAYDLMYKAGYRTVTVPTANGDRREIPID